MLEDGIGIGVGMGMIGHIVGIVVGGSGDQGRFPGHSIRRRRGVVVLGGGKGIIVNEGVDERGENIVGAVVDVVVIVINGIAGGIGQGDCREIPEGQSLMIIGVRVGIGVLLMMISDGNGNGSRGRRMSIIRNSIMRGERLVGTGINALADELLAEMGVPVVLYLVVRSPRDPPRYQRPPVAQEAMEAEDEILLVGGDVAALHGGAEIVHPPEAAAFPAAEETRSFWEGAPPALSLLLDVVGQQLVFLRSPRPSLQPYFAAARCTALCRFCPARRLSHIDLSLWICHCQQQDLSDWDSACLHTICCTKPLYILPYLSIHTLIPFALPALSR